MAGGAWLHLRTEEIWFRLVIVRRGELKSELPMHGGRKELGMSRERDQKQLGLK